jgi:hypothetical protein
MISYLLDHVFDETTAGLGRSQGWCQVIKRGCE